MVKKRRFARVCAKSLLHLSVRNEMGEPNIGFCKRLLRGARLNLERRRPYKLELVCLYHRLQIFAEHKPAKIISQTLIIKYEIANSFGKPIPLPLALLAPEQFLFIFG